MSHLRFFFAITAGLAAAHMATAQSAGRITPVALSEDAEGAGDEAVAAVAPDSAPKSATSHLAQCRIAYDRLQSQVVDAYQRTSQDPPAQRDKVVAWLKRCATADADLGGAPSAESLLREGEALIEEGCKHPIVLSYVANGNLAEGRLQLSKERHDLAAPKLMAGEYGPLPCFLEACRLVRFNFFKGREARWLSERAAGEAWIDLAVKNDHHEWERLLWADLSWLIDNNRGWEGANLLLLEIAADERIAPWLREMAAGKAADDQAWKIRGGGYADKIDEKNWAPFYEKIAKSKTHFLKAHELEPNRPEAAAGLIRVANAEPDAEADNLRHWFDEARAAQVDYLPAYENLLWGMLPQWHGSHKEIFALARQWQTEGLEATNAPSMALRAVYDIGGHTGGWEKTLQSKTAYTLVVSALQSMADDPQHGVSVRRNLNRGDLLSEIVAAALKSGRASEALAALETLEREGFKLNPVVMRVYELPPEQAVPRLYALTGKAASTVAGLEAVSDNDRHASRATLSGAITAYENAKREADDPRADAYFDHVIRVCSLERDFHDGEWALPKFDGALTDWHHPTVGFWEVESPKAIVARQSDESGAPTLWTECRLGQSYEVEADIEPLYETGPESMNGVYVGAIPDGYFFHVNCTARRATISQGANLLASKPIEDKASYRIAAKVWPNYAELSVDGEKLIGIALKDFEPSGYFSLSSVPRYGGAEVRYSNVRFRKLEPRDESGGAE